MNWDHTTRDTQLAALVATGPGKIPLTGSNLTIARMWVYQRDLEYWGNLYAEAKTEYGRTYGRAVVKARMDGEKSAEVAGHKAEQQDDVFTAHLNYRRAEQMVTADREALKILHAQLDEWRTNQANEREANRFSAREGT
jgi:hypothetical protein